MKRQRHGFTLVELLVVVAIIGVLLGLVSKAVQAAVNTAKKQRCNAEANALKAAIENYRHDYNHWPMPTEDKNPTAWANNNDVGNLDYGMVYYEWDRNGNAVVNRQNYRVLDFLAGDNVRDNPKEKTYLDYNALYMHNAKNTLVIVARFLNNGQWVPETVRPRNYLENPYRIVINVVYNSVEVSQKE